MNANTSNTCKALDMLERAEILDVNGFLIHNWHLDTLDCGEDEPVIEFSYTDEEGYVFEFSFNKKGVEEASIVGNSISMVDDVGETVEVSCFALTALA